MGEPVSSEAQVLRIAFLEERAPVTACFTTRQGGVSGGELGALNLSYTVGDDPEAVAQNRRRALAAVGAGVEQAVVAGLVHGTATYVVASDPAGWPRWQGEEPIPDSTPVRWREGAGFVGGVDGLCTAMPGTTLVITAADCVPVYVVDPVQGAVGLAHAGWRGSVGDMAGALVRTMARELGSRPDDLLAAIGPSIGPCCFEVDEPVIAPLRAALPDAWQALARATAPGKWHLDLWELNRRLLVAAGVPAAHVHLTGVCTCCTTHQFFSHRGQRGQAGRGAAILRWTGAVN